MLLARLQSLDTANCDHYHPLRLVNVACCVLIQIWVWNVHHVHLGQQSKDLLDVPGAVAGITLTAEEGLYWSSIIDD